MSDNSCQDRTFYRKHSSFLPSEMTLGYPSARLAGASRLSETPGRGNIRLKSTAPAECWSSISTRRAEHLMEHNSLFGQGDHDGKPCLRDSRDINLETYARELGVLSAYEEMEKG